MLNELVYRNGDYTEIVVLETQAVWMSSESGKVYTEKVQLIMCCDGPNFKLYRLHAPYTDKHNAAFYDSLVAIAAYQEAFSGTLELTRIAEDLPARYADYYHRQNQ